MKRLEEIVRDLPPQLQEEVIDFAAFLLMKYGLREQRSLKQDWAGALAAYRDRYTSLDLQKKSLEWRGD